MEKKKTLLQALPKVDDAMATLIEEVPNSVPAVIIKKSVRMCIEEERSLILSGPDSYVQKTEEEWKHIFLNTLEKNLESNLKRVINGSGVVIHTNLGRSLLSQKATRCLVNCSEHYSNLEFDLVTGQRGSRYKLVEELICDLTKAEAALVVNNNAAAVLLVLDTLANGKEAIVSRGQLVEIGGSFRIPDVMAKSGAKLIEVGATNRTHYYDYENAITESTSLLLKVHMSNFRMLGFTSEVPAEKLVSLARQYGILVMEDLGSGCFVDLAPYGLPKEPTVQEVVKSGVDVVTFSGDKLLGGPQAGIIVGKKDVIEKVKKNPLNRALRIDKFTLASLESVLREYYDTSQALENVPTLNMLTQDEVSIKRKAQRVMRALKKADINRCSFSLIPTSSRVGGGALPEYSLKSWAIKIIPDAISINRFENDMRKLKIPLIGRIENEYFLIDFRTVQEDDIVEITSIIKSYFKEIA